jgi:exonuclease SbcD
VNYLKIITFADLHLGVSAYGKIDPGTNLNSRVISALNSLDIMINYAINNDIKLVIAAGDMYKNSSISSSIQAEFNKRIRRLIDNDIKVLMLDGNHDVDRIETKKSPMVVYDDLRVEHVIQTRFHKEFNIEIDNEKIKVVFLPTYHTEEEIRNIVNETQYDGNPIVFIFHGTIRGANLNDWNIAENETYVEPSVFDKEGVSAVVMGHLHKHQILYNSPLVYYTGSLQRVDFSEEKQPKGFVLLDVQRDLSTKYDFIEIESQTFLTLDFNIVNQENETDFILGVIEKNKKRIKDSIVRLRVQMDKSNFINETKIYEVINSFSPHNILDIQKKIEKQDSVRNSELTEYVDEYKALEIFFKEKDNFDTIVSYGKQLIKDAKEKGVI